MASLNHASPRECTRFFELDWYDGIEAGLFSLRGDDGEEHWFLARRVGGSYGQSGDNWYLYECTRVRSGFEPYLDPPDPGRERFVEEGFFEAAIDAVGERVDDSTVMLALFVGDDHRRILRTFSACGAGRMGSEVWSRLFTRPTV
jgi:hypothetical protein